MFRIPSIVLWALLSVFVCDAALPNATFFSNEKIAAALAAGSKDWQADGLVTRVKNQGNCGSCWVFATIATIETTNAISGTQNLTALSEQFVLDCISNGRAGMDGCVGGVPSTLVEKLDTGDQPFPMERIYEYISYNKSIQACQTAIPTTNIRVTGGFVVAAGPGQSMEDAMAAWVYWNGPITVSVKAYSDLWNNYDSGILTCPASTVIQQLDHAVTIVGYGVENTVPYWKIKNSWTPRWGEGGYIRLQRGVNACGVAFTPVVISV
jgi:hypothetical protein